MDGAVFPRHICFWPATIPSRRMRDVALRFLGKLNEIAPPYAALAPPISAL
jgi:hypothetical protein